MLLRFTKMHGLGNDFMVIDLISQHAHIQPKHARQWGDRHTGIGFVVGDLDAAHAELAARGVRFTQAPTRQPWGGYMALFTDPDGNVFYLDQVDQTAH